MTDFRNKPHYKECIVSYLVVRRFGPLANAFAADDIEGILDMFRCRTCPDGDETAENSGELGIVIDPFPGTGAGTIVRAKPIGAQAGSAPLVRELTDLLHLQLQCLENETTVRGAVAIDFLHVGPELGGPHFGPALSRAREMEANEIVFPRIAVEEEVFRRLRSDESLWAQDHVLRDEMDVIDSMTTMDEAGMHYIDYLRAGLGDFDYDFARYAEFLGSHKNFVETGLADTSLAGDPATYHWLKNYHNARIDDDIAPSDRDTFIDECELAMSSALAPLRIA